MPKRRPIRTTRHRNKAKPASDKFIIGMVFRDRDGNPTLSMFKNPKLYDTYDKAKTAAQEKYSRYPTAKFVVFAKACAVGAPVLAPLVEEWSF